MKSNHDKLWRQSYRTIHLNSKVSQILILGTLTGQQDYNHYILGSVFFQTHEHAQQVI